MRSLSLLLLLALAPFPVGAQTTSPKAQTRPRSAGTVPTPKPSPTPTPRDPKPELEAARSITDPLERLNALLKFISDFPEAEETRRARELSVSTRAEIGDSKLAAGDVEDGVLQFKLAAESAPTPVSEELFSKVLLQFPANLFARGQRAAAFDVAAIIEKKAEGDAKQLLALSTFFISVEYSSEAFRLATKAVEISPDLPLAYYTLGTAGRLGFRLDDATAAFTKALELEPESISARRNLADLLRASGKAEESAKLYREILEKDANDNAARSALALSLFDLGKREEAEKEMEAALAVNSSDVTLLTGAALWYAANGDGAKAVELALRSRAADSKYTWAYVAEARGYVAQKKPLEAERVLLLARTIGNFPTLDYELAVVRYSAGLYREAAEALGTNFSVKDGLVSTYLGNRVLADAESIPQLLSLEHKAAILAPSLGYDARTASGLKSLLEFSQAIGTGTTIDEEAAKKAAESFASGDDNMRTHRQLFAASRLLQNKIAPDKALDLTRASIAGLDASIEVTSPSAAVLADELYETRSAALQRSQIVIFPEIDKQTLTSIMRGRVEELSGWALLLKNQPEQAIVRIRRGLTVLPEDSAWWRSSQWRLGNALEALDRKKEALEAYIRGYSREFPDFAQYQYISTLYEQVNGSLDGLEARVGRNPSLQVARVEPSPTPLPTPEVVRIPDVVPIATPTPTPVPEVKSEVPAEAPVKLDENVPTVEASPSPSATPEATPTPEPVPTEEKKEEPKAEPAPIPEPAPTPTPSPVEEKKGEVKAEPKPEPTPEPTPAPAEEKKEEPKSESTPEVTPAPAPTPVVEERKEEVKPEPTPAPIEEKKEESKSESAPEPSTLPTPPTPAVEEKKEEVKVEASPKPSTLPTPVVEEKKEEPKVEASPKPSTLPTPESTPVVEEKKEEPKVEPAPAEEKKEESKPAPKPLFEPIIITAPARPSQNETRSRVAPKEPELKACTIMPTSESVTIFANGGLWGLLVGIENGNIADLKASSDSPSDLTVTEDKGPKEETARRFFIIRSVSERTGEFKVTFSTPCGSKDVLVTVRNI